MWRTSSAKAIGRRCGSGWKGRVPDWGWVSRRWAGAYRFQGIIIVRITKGQIVEGWNSYDQLGLLRQIGALPGQGDRDLFLNPS